MAYGPLTGLPEQWSDADRRDALERRRALRAPAHTWRDVVAAMAQDVAALMQAERLVGYNALRAFGWSDDQIRCAMQPACWRAQEIMAAGQVDINVDAAAPRKAPSRPNPILQVALTVASLGRVAAKGAMALACICAFGVGLPMAGEILRSLT